MYRRSSKNDHVSDYLPPSKTDYEIEFEKENGLVAAFQDVICFLTDNRD